jgi:aspartyl-tRNA(Asn)/glutamyl-tRNA(Gln) amidotransferase subunit A
MKYYMTQLSDKGTVAVDDTILVKDCASASGSRILEGFKPLFSAEAVTRLEDKGYQVSGKTNVGEFGLDLVGEFSYYNNQEGQLEGAAASLVKNGEIKAALGVDMNGATRRSAALAGVDFLKPTYGTVSRYGVISCAASGEQIGVYAKDSTGVKEIMDVIAGHDDKDGTSLPAESYDYSVDKDVAGKKVCIIKYL